jgi:hypothetical protein
MSEADLFYPQQPPQHKALRYAISLKESKRDAKGRAPNTAGA